MHVTSINNNISVTVFFRQIHSCTGHMTQTRGDMGHMIKLGWNINKVLYPNVLWNHSLVQRLYLSWGKRIRWIWTVSLVWLALRACADTAVQKQISDLNGSARLHGCMQARGSNFTIISNGIPAVSKSYDCAKTAIGLECSIPFPGPRIVSIFTRPIFPPWGWGLSTRLWN